MKKFTAIIITAALIAGLTGCNKPSDSGDSSTTDSTSTTSESTQSTESADESVPGGEPTNLVGPDGKPIYTSEINTNITDPEIIKRLSGYTSLGETVEPDAVVDSFMFFKPSTGIAYNIHDNPELYSEDENGFRNFIGEKPENSNEWRRVNVGDKICGLTLKTAEMGLVKDEDGYSLLDTYYYEFDGELTLTGYLYVTSAAEFYDIPGGEMTLYFFDGSVPMIPSSAAENAPDGEKGFTDSIIFNHIEFIGTSEVTSLLLDETIDETSVDMTGITRGDVIKVKATVSNLRMNKAHLESIEILSEVIENG